MLKRLKINNLYGYRSIDIEFNPKITFLIGRNGSGKTTVLNIIASIISGNLNFLTRYEFDNLELLYEYRNVEKIISIKRENKNTYLLQWQNKKLFIDLDGLENQVKGFYKTSPFYKDKSNEHITQNELLEEISNEFNQLYLPLSRDINIDNLFGMSNPRKEYTIRFLQDGNESELPSSIDKAMDYVTNLVKDEQRKIMIQFEKLNKKMQTEMFKSSFNLSAGNLQSKVENFSYLLNAKYDIKNAFKEMNMLTQDFEKEIDNFFANLEEMFSGYQEWANDKSENKSIAPSVFKFIENSSLIERMLDWKDVVLRTNKSKLLIKSKMDIFFDIVNSYLEDTGKKMYLKTGNDLLTFDNKYGGKDLKLEFLSSGEKQLIIFFAYLILKVNKGKNESTFIVDEPELSLHLRWQKRFSKDLLNVASNLQILIATHSPDIVGEFRNCIVPLGGEEVER